MTVVIYFLLLSMVIYAGMLLWFQIGNLFYRKKISSQETPPVSIIIAIRNGGDSLPQLLADLSAQDREELGRFADYLRARSGGGQG